ncbi:hypothetical protein DFH09DRAFT_1357490 [Mycena vulgaris]|nr:hypothetical protein DFH09DRAFT_1357490 [Mycena vulgaris]
MYAGRSLPPSSLALPSPLQDVIAQHVFVRGRTIRTRTYGAVRASYALMYLQMRPDHVRDTLPPSYQDLCQLQAGRSPADPYRFNLKAIQEHTVDLPVLDRLIARPDVAPPNLASLLALRDRALAGASDLKVVLWMLPSYVLRAAPRAGPPLPLPRLPRGARPLTHPGRRREPAQLCLTRRLRPVFCIKHSLYERLRASSRHALLPPRAADALVARGFWWLYDLSTGLALLIEDPRRRAELAMYVLPKGLDSLWVIARGQGIVRRTGIWGDGVLAEMGMGMVMDQDEDGTAVFLSVLSSVHAPRREPLDLERAPDRGHASWWDVVGGTAQPLPAATGVCLGHVGAVPALSSGGGGSGLAYVFDVLRVHMCASCRPAGDAAHMSRECHLQPAARDVSLRRGVV